MSVDTYLVYGFDITYLMPYTTGINKPLIQVVFLPLKIGDSKMRIAKPSTLWGLNISFLLYVISVWRAFNTMLTVGNLQLLQALAVATAAFALVIYLANLMTAVRLFWPVVVLPSVLGMALVYHYAASALAPGGSIAHLLVSMLIGVFFIAPWWGWIVSLHSQLVMIRVIITHIYVKVIPYMDEEEEDLSPRRYVIIDEFGGLLCISTAGQHRFVEEATPDYTILFFNTANLAVERALETNWYVMVD